MAASKSVAFYWRGN